MLKKLPGQTVCGDSCDRLPELNLRETHGVDLVLSECERQVRVSMSKRERIKAERSLDLPKARMVSQGPPEHYDQRCPVRHQACRSSYVWCPSLNGPHDTLGVVAALVEKSKRLADVRRASG